MTSVLAIDTSDYQTHLALLLSSGEVKATKVGAENSHSEELSLGVEKLLTEAGLDIKDIGSIVFGSGPGSFTGLRIGYSFVEGLALALKVPVIVFSSLEAAIRGVELKEDALLLAIKDARRNEVFLRAEAVFWQNGKLHKREVRYQDQILALNKIREVINEASDPKGTGLLRLSPYILTANAFPELEEMLEVNLGVADFNIATGLLDLHQEHNSDPSKQLLGPQDLAKIELNYLRAVAAKTIKERGGE